MARLSVYYGRYPIFTYLPYARKAADMLRVLAGPTQLMLRMVHCPRSLKSKVELTALLSILLFLK